ncbi:MAG: dephospho-CoA kinase [Verrucomicrobia bacterium]|nr:dephospho-CoA kinase [Verrucomicrobiota bacterium]
MLELKKIAITGGVASGKSTVCRFFQELGAYVVSADAIAHDLLSLETNLGQKVLQQFGSDILQEGKISRRILAEKVFKNPAQLEALEKLLHPAVLQKIDELYRQAAHSRKWTSFVVEIPLLYEIHAEDSYDVIVAVLADEKVAKERFKQSGFQPEEYERRMSRQIKPSQKAKRATYTLINNGSLDQLRQEVIKLNSILKENQFS